MSWIALLLVLAAPDTLRQTLLDEVYTIPAADWRYVPVVLHQPPVVVDCQFHVISAGSTVRVSLMDSQGLAALRKGRVHPPIAATDFEPDGHLRQVVRDAGEYAVVVDNNRSAERRVAVDVRLLVSLDFGARSQTQARELSPRRRFAVISISLLVFLAIVAYSGRRLIAVWR